MPSSSRDRSSAPWAVLAILLLTPAVAVGGWAAIAAQPNRAAAAAPVAPVVVVPVLERAELAVARTVTVESGEGLEARSQASGLVTREPVPGVLLEQGDVVLVLDDRPVRAFVGTTPFWRPLVVGDRGDDVRALQEYLVETGYLSGAADGVFGDRLRTAVAEFNVDSGLGRGVGSFDPATVVWVGPSPLRVATVPVRAGDSVAPGQPVVVGPAAAVAITVSDPTDGGAPIPEGEVGPFELAVGATVVPYDPDDSRIVDTDAVVALAAAVGPASAAQGTVRSVARREVLVVPASALVQGADGTTCVYPAQDADPVVVEPVGGGVASVQLDPTTELDTVLVNPGTTSPDVPCAS
ncbi:peptidoglycan-binding protein [Cellulosimicrobium cellulans]|uniref:peptidoglycan-binding domain-containing protein n=1 Tax=Cellulosimicrobium cellulans TaxID=1710 RepID=UPI00381665C4